MHVRAEDLWMRKGAEKKKNEKNKNKMKCRKLCRVIRISGRLVSLAVCSLLLLPFPFRHLSLIVRWINCSKKAVCLFAFSEMIENRMVKRCVEANYGTCFESNLNRTPAIKSVHQGGIHRPFSPEMFNTVACRKIIWILLADYKFREIRDCVANSKFAVFKSKHSSRVSRSCGNIRVSRSQRGNISHQFEFQAGSSFIESQYRLLNWISDYRIYVASLMIYMRFHLLLHLLHIVEVEFKNQLQLIKISLNINRSIVQLWHFVRTI